MACKTQLLAGVGTLSISIQYLILFGSLGANLHDFWCLGDKFESHVFRVYGGVQGWLHGKRAIGIKLSVLFVSQALVLQIFVNIGLEGTVDWSLRATWLCREAIWPQKQQYFMPVRRMFCSKPNGTKQTK